MALLLSWSWCSMRHFRFCSYSKRKFLQLLQDLCRQNYETLVKRNKLNLGQPAGGKTNNCAIKAKHLQLNSVENHHHHILLWESLIDRIGELIFCRFFCSRLPHDFHQVHLHYRVNNIFFYFSQNNFSPIIFNFVSSHGSTKESPCWKLSLNCFFFKMCCQSLALLKVLLPNFQAGNRS